MLILILGSPSKIAKYFFIKISSPSNKVRAGIVNYDPESVYGSRSGFQEVLLVTSKDKGSVPGLEISIYCVCLLFMA